MKMNRTCVGLSKFSNQFKCGVNKPDIIILPAGLVTPGATWSGDWPRETNYEFMANWKERKCLFAPECFCSYHKRTVHPAVKQNRREISMKALWPFTWLTVDLMNKVWLMTGGPDWFTVMAEWLLSEPDACVPEAVRLDGGSIGADAKEKTFWSVCKNT